MPSASGGGGFAFSFPGLTGGEWDFGFYGQVEQGVDGYNIPRARLLGKATGELGYGFGDLRTNLAGVQGQVGAMLGFFGGSVGANSDGANQFTFRAGGGYEISGSVVKTSVFSVRRLIDWLRK